MILNSITKTVSIDAPVSKVFEFVADAATWPQWAIVNVKSIKRAEGDWWDMDTPLGPAKLRIRPHETLGILDHDFNAAEASWSVPSRVVPNGSGCELMMTFYQPPSFSKDFFEQQISLVGKELAKLKELMEAKPR